MSSDIKENDISLQELSLQELSLQELFVELKKVHIKLDKIIEDTNKMNNHINFIENIYNNLRSTIMNVLSIFGPSDSTYTLEYRNSEIKN